MPLVLLSTILGRLLTQEIVTQFIILLPLTITILQRMAQRNKPRDQTRRKQRIKHNIKDIPKSNIISPNFPKLPELITQKSKRKYIEEDFCNIQISSWINCV